jgi:ribosome biogenesis SPOUT family RNA methylase Rps3
MEMKRLINRIPATLLLSGLFATTILAQTSAKEIAANLRVQLSEVQVKKAEMQALDEQLEEDLKPENIERSLAGIGSTRPERLREQRRRQLEIARAGIRIQLDELDRSQTRLETAIAEADAVAYWQSAGIAIGTTQRTNNLP